MKSPFDIARDLYSKKTPWNDDIEKSWDTFMINKILSMNQDLIEIIDMIQRFYNIPEKTTHELYRNVVPSTSRFYPYLKTEKTISNDIKIISKQYDLSKRDARDYLDILSEKELQTIRDQKEDPIYTAKKLKSNDRRKTK